jgi:hypothetical protein
LSRLRQSEDYKNFHSAQLQKKRHWQLLMDVLDQILVAGHQDKRVDF